MILTVFSETGNRKGFGYIQYDSIDSSREAVEKMNGAFIAGRAIRTDFSTPVIPPPAAVAVVAAMVVAVDSVAVVAVVTVVVVVVVVAGSVAVVVVVTVVAAVVVPAATVVDSVTLRGQRRSLIKCY